MNHPAIDIDAFNIFDVPNMTGTPERRLLLAILERALLDYVGNDNREFEEAENWIFNDEPKEDTAYDLSSEFSFSWICQELDLDISSIRDKVRQMPRRGASRIAPWYLTKGYSKNEESAATKSSDFREVSLKPKSDKRRVFKLLGKKVA